MLTFAASAVTAVVLIAGCSSDGLPAADASVPAGALDIGIVPARDASVPTPDLVESGCDTPHLDGGSCGPANHAHVEFPTTQPGAPYDPHPFDIEIRAVLPRQRHWLVSGFNAMSSYFDIELDGKPDIGVRYALVASVVASGQATATLYQYPRNQPPAMYFARAGEVEITDRCGNQIAFNLKADFGGFTAAASGSFPDPWPVSCNDRACGSDSVAIPCGNATCRLGTWCSTTDLGAWCQCGNQQPYDCACDYVDPDHPGCGLISGCP